MMAGPIETAVGVLILFVFGVGPYAVVGLVASLMGSLLGNSLARNSRGKGDAVFFGTIIGTVTATIAAIIFICVELPMWLSVAVGGVSSVIVSHWLARRVKA